MIRKAKALGIALIAICAMSAVAASAAQATEARFKCGTDTTKICEVTVEADPQVLEQTLKTKAGAIACERFHATAQIPDGVKQSSVTLTGLEYNECEFAGLAASVTIPEGCHYTLTAGNTEAEPENSTGNVTLSETAGKACTITIKSLTCTVTVKPTQAFENSVTYSNQKTTGKPEEITGHLTTGKKLKYKTSAGCPGGAGEAEDGELTGKFTARAFELKSGGATGTQTDLTVEDA